MEYRLKQTGSEVQSLLDKIEPIEKAQAELTRTRYIEIAWSELKRLRDNDLLIPATWYRITDYMTTTTELGTGVSAYALFDILILATSKNTLSEEAFALHSERPAYFGEFNLNAWKLWYSIDNDKSKFNWADEINGKGVIYRMIDEFNNDAPYDFYSIFFVYANKVAHTFGPIFEKKSYNNIIKSSRDSKGRLTIPDVFFTEGVHDIEVSKNSKGEWVAYNKADIFSTTIFGPEPEPEPPQPYAQADGTAYYIGEI